MHAEIHAIFLLFCITCGFQACLYTSLSKALFHEFFLYVRIHREVVVMPVCNNLTVFD